MSMGRLQRLAACAGAFVMVACAGPSVRRVSALLYVVGLGSGTDLSLRLVTADGRERRILADTQETGNFVSFSPDGTRAEYSLCAPSAGQGVTLRVVPYDGSKAIEFGRPGWAAVPDGFSPDGRKVLMEACADGDESTAVFYVLDLASGAAKELPVTGQECAWAPAGDRIAVLDRRAAGPSLYIVDCVTNSVRKVPCALEADASWIAWAPDGQAIGLLLGGPVCSIVLVDVTTGVARVVTEDAHYTSRYISCWSWSPKGDKLLLASDFTTTGGERGIGAVSVLDLNAGRETRLPITSGWYCPFWSPDGSEVAVLADLGGQGQQIYRYELAGGRLVQVTHDREEKTLRGWQMVALTGQGVLPGKPAE